jgi:hypothetical protein
VSLVDAFWSESTPAIRRLFLDEAAGRSGGVAEFQFDVFDVVLDFEFGTATVVDVLSQIRSTSVTDLESFLARADIPHLAGGHHTLN